MLVSAQALQPVETPLDAEEISRRAPIAVPIEISGTPCAAYFDDEACAKLFQRRYRRLISVQHPLHKSFALRCTGSAPLFYASRLGGLVWPHGDLDVDAFVFLADAVAITQFLASLEGTVSFHAAAVRVGNSAVAIIGDSTAGKTTTALACARRGMALYSDEQCIVDHGRVVAFPRALNLRSHGLQLLLQDDVGLPDPIGKRLRARPPGPWEGVDYGDLFEDWSAPPPLPLGAVFLLAEAQAVPQAKGISHMEAVKAAAKWAKSVNRGLDLLAQLIALFEHVPCYRLAMGSPDATAQAIEAASAMQGPRS